MALEVIFIFVPTCCFDSVSYKNPVISTIGGDAAEN
jgi:hypothetical protein